MPRRAYYLQEAQRLFDMALMARDPVVRGRWIERANEHLMPAHAMPKNEDTTAPECP